MKTFAPIPPASSRCDSPMTMEDVEFWIDSYNRWVELWNKHETSKDLPLSPEWPEAYNVASGIGDIPKSALAFVPGRKIGGKMGIIRLGKWQAFHRGWSF